VRADSAAVGYAPPGGEVTAGIYETEPSECGPYPVGGEPSGTAADSLVITTKAFDGGVTSTAGDLFAGSTFAPVTIKPGKSATIIVTIKPSEYPSGSVVKGTLYVDAFDGGIPPYGAQSASELYALPYKFTADR
jgi:hypothetical protein